MVSYTDITDTGLVIDVPGASAARATAAVCAVRARARDGAGGRSRPRSPCRPGSPAVVPYQLATTARPFIGEVVRCRAASDIRWRLRLDRVSPIDREGWSAKTQRHR